MLSLVSASTAFQAPFVAPATGRAADVRMETVADLKALAEKCNPVVGFWDPMNLAEYDQFSQGEAATVGFLRQAEIKHGRVAMAAFVGYCVQANGIHFPWALTGPIPIVNPDTATITFGDISAAGGPSDQWDALPSSAKLQI